MRSWIERRVVALFDSLLGAVVFAAAAVLLPVSFVLQAIALAALLLGLWMLLRSQAPDAARIATDAAPAEGVDPRVPLRRWDPVPSPSYKPPKGGLVSPLEVMGLQSPTVLETSGSEAVGRNDPCWCGSGKRFKKCHGA